MAGVQRREQVAGDNAFKEAYKGLSVKHVMQTMGHQWLYTYGPQCCVPWKMNAEMADTGVTSPLRSVLIHQNPINVIAKKDTATLLELVPVSQSVPKAVNTGSVFFPRSVFVTLATLQ